MRVVGGGGSGGGSEKPFMGQAPRKSLEFRFHSFLYLSVSFFFIAFKISAGTLAIVPCYEDLPLLVMSAVCHFSFMFFTL